tara:strand:- start:699 stop:1172 length:474 start_codon:yes stop_codon:yes gene_type:complete
MNNKTVDFWVGLFVLAGFFAMVFLSFQVGNMNLARLSPTYNLTARFDNIGSLKIRAPVKSSGVVVGRVDKIQFNNKTFQASVRIEMNSSYSFPKDSSLKILTSGLLGEQYIGIEPGGNEIRFKDGDLIKNTQSAIVLENLISQFLFSKALESSGESN